ncbi:MAG: hypothetical protein P8Q17_06185 [Methylophilaceae bacterium]|nr:hypothetical protein [Methylophilaceae bacterium]
MTYFLILTFAGFLIGNFLTQHKGVVIIIIIAILWGISTEVIWGLVSLGELLLGFYLSKIIAER